MIDRETLLLGMLNLAKPPMRGIRHVHRRASEYSQSREIDATAYRIARSKGIADAGRLRQDALDYAGDVFGSPRWGPHLFLYAAVRGRFESGWIPESFFHHVLNKQMLVGLSQAKGISRRIFGSSAFPDVAYVSDRLLWSADWQPRPGREAKELLFSQTETVVFKPNSGLRGVGIRIFEQATFDERVLASLPDGVFQAFVEQHDDLSVFGSPSATTLRLITVMQGTEPEYRAAYLRVGRSQDRHVASDSNLRVAIGRDGALAATGYLPDWSTTDRHPDSGVTFSGRSMPQFAQAVALALDLHRRCPFFSSIGWDICVDRSGHIRIFEFNINHDIKFVEATLGPCFKGLGWESVRRPG